MTDHYEKPEVVAWRWRKPVVNDQGETIGATAWKLNDTPGFLPWWTNEPLIRLSDYKALQAENERLAEALRELREYVTAALQAEREAFAGHEDCSDIPGIEADLHKIDAMLREQEEGA